MTSTIYDATPSKARGKENPHFLNETLFKLHYISMETIISRESVEKLTMMGKTISAYTDADTANRIEWIATREHRKKAQIAGSAVKLFVNLPEEARTAWRQIEALGTPAEIEQISQDIARALLHAQYAMAHKQVIQEMTTEHLGSLETEDDLLNAAVSLTR
jgi:predicted transcriptional regulator